MRAEVAHMFDRIAPRYDLLNRVLSLRRDVSWRRRLVREALEKRPRRLLDLATGTGDVIAELERQCRRCDSKTRPGSRPACKRARPGLEYVAGIDAAATMPALARSKLGLRRTRLFLPACRVGDADMLKQESGSRTRPAAGFRFLPAQGDAVCLPVPDCRFDVVTMAFGIRNVVDVRAALSEIHRVLAPGGTVLILEFSRPGPAPLRIAYLLYLRHVLPRIGTAISGDGDAYAYLNRTIESFPSGVEFMALMQQAGFAQLKEKRLTFGIATLYEGSKSYE